MSIKVMEWAWKVPLKSTDKLMLLALCDHADDESFQCWPSVTHLQKKTGLSRPAVWQSINRLIEKGIVKRAGISQKGNTIYEIRVGNEVTQVGKEITHQVGNEVTQQEGSRLRGYLGVGNEVTQEVGKEVTSKPSVYNRHITVNDSFSTLRGESNQGSPPQLQPEEKKLSDCLQTKQAECFRNPIPQSLTPDDRTQMHALNLLIPQDQWQAITDDFLDYLRAEGKQCADYQAGLRRWMKGWKKRSPANVQTWPGEHNQQNLRSHYGGNQGYRQGRCPKTGRKLAPGELSLLQEREYAERQRAKQARVINPRPDEFDDFEALDEDEQSLRPSLAIDLWQCH